MIKFVRTWRDVKDKKNDKLGKLYGVMSTARFNAVKEQKLIKQGVAIKISKDGRPVKSNEPDKLETKSKK